VFTVRETYKLRTIRLSRF